MDFLCKNINPILSTTGLLLDIIGVIMVFNFGVPKEIDGTKISYLNADDTSTKIGPSYGLKVYLGISLILIGFLLQIISNWV